MNPSGHRWGITAGVCAGVIAVCYGFARYAYGLFVPEFREVFGLSATGIGVLGGVSTAGYTVGLLAAPALSRRSGRSTTVLAGACAATGLLGLAATELLGLFAVGLFIAGTGAGLVSPGVAELIGRTVCGRAEDRAQTWANTGTSLGLAVSAFTPVLAFGWQLTWLGFGLLALVVTAAALVLLPRDVLASQETTPGVASLRRPGLVLLLFNSLLLGLTSAPYWNFSVDRLAEAGLPSGVSSWFWLTIGLAGPLGGIAGAVVARYGLAATNLGTWTIWAATMGLLALPVPHPWVALIFAALFGTTFIALTGLCILWGARLYPEAPARGVTLSFLCLGAGQTLGSPLAGAIADASSLGVVFALTAAAGLLSYHQVHPRLRPPKSRH